MRLSILLILFFFTLSLKATSSNNFLENLEKRDPSILQKVGEEQEEEEVVIPVWVRINIENILLVDEKTPRADIDVTVDMLWDSGNTTDSSFVPQVLFSNIVLSRKQPDKSPRQTIYEKLDGTSQLTSRVVGSFGQNFDFRDFPFDSQELFVALEAEKGVQYYFYDDQVSSELPPEFTMQTWYPTTDRASNIIKSKEITFFEGIQNVSMYLTKFPISREVNSFILTNILPGLFAVFISTTQVFLNLEKYFSVRVSISVWSLVLLANIQSFPFSIIPRGEKINYLEYFGLCNYFLMLLNFFELMIAQWFQAHQHRNWRRALDYTARWLLPSFCVILNGCLLFLYAGDTWRGAVIWTTLTFTFTVAIMIYIAHHKIMRMMEENKDCQG